MFHTAGQMEVRLKSRVHISTVGITISMRHSTIDDLDGTN